MNTSKPRAGFNCGAKKGKMMNKRLEAKDKSKKTQGVKQAGERMHGVQTGNKTAETIRQEYADSGGYISRGRADRYESAQD